MGIEFLGNKRQLGSFIMDHINTQVDPKCKSCFDVFSGSGSVSAVLKKHGFDVIANDFLYFSTVLTKSILLNNSAPHFKGILPLIQREKLQGTYKDVLEYLNALDGKEGFIYQYYSPASAMFEDTKRMYFTEENAKKIDAIRMKIEEWLPFLQENEKSLLLSDLIKAVVSVSNIAGTYGCYMKYWKKKAVSAIELVQSEFISGSANAVHRVYQEDANEIVKYVAADIVYADPPYTKRQYSAYYHLLETVALYDNPVLVGKTGLRNWKEKTSDYCYKKKAPHALEDLVRNVQCKYFILSYNDESQIPHERVMEILSLHGNLTVRETPYKKYKSNSADRDKEGVIERLYILKMENGQNDVIQSQK